MYLKHYKKAFVPLFSLYIAFAAAQSPVAEPANWWIGMNNPKLQLMVRGEGIGETSPSIARTGVTIVGTHLADSKNYLFIDLNIAKTAQAGTFPIVFKKNNKEVARLSYTLMRRPRPAADLKGFTSSDVIYLITPDRFANNDPSNDALSALREKTVDRSKDYSRHGGDIKGITAHLDYIADMGFTAIWPGPVLENDMPQWSYHGYAITDHYKTDPRFGSLDDYRELAEKAREKGLKLIFDGVVNHIGVEHAWMKDLPFKDWINYADSMQLTTHRRTTHEDPYAAKADRDLMVKGWFVPSMPDLNTDNPFLATYMIQNSVWWIETLGLGGIRQDTWPYSSKKFLGSWSCHIMREYPNFSIVAEEWSTNPLIASYWQKGKRNNGSYLGCLKSPMDFPLQAALTQALAEPENWNTGLIKLYEALANDFAYAEPRDLMVFGDNHDMDRLFTQLRKDPALLQMALTYLATIRGIPQIYYGTEILADNSAKPGDHGLIRSDFPGGWSGDAVNAFTGQGLSAEQRRMQAYLKRLLQWRKGKTVIHEGKTLHFGPADGVYVYFRYNAQETVMVAINKNNAPVALRTDRFVEILGGKKQAVNVFDQTNQPIGATLSLPARAATVFEIK